MPPYSQRSTSCICSSLRPPTIERHPVGELSGNRERLVGSGKVMGIAQSGEQLVDRVERRPPSVQIERLRADVAAGDFGKQPLPFRDGGDVTVAVGPLTRGQLADDVRDAITEARVVRRAVHQRACGEVVPEAVPGELFGLPPAIDGGSRLEPCLLPEPREQPIGLELQQIIAILIGRRA